MQALLLGGTIFESEEEEGSRRWRRMQSAAINASWQSDFDRLIEQLTSLSAKPKIDVFGFRPAAPDVQKRDTLDIIKAFFNSEDVKLYLLYWSGHGAEGSGDWVFSQGRTLSLVELLTCWKKSEGGKKARELLVVSDCCYSGCWCSALSSITSSGNKFKNLKVCIQAACAATETAFWDERGSYLTRKLLCDARMKNKTDESEFIWGCYRQHPTFALSYTRKIVSAPTGERFCIVGPFRITSIEAEWTISGSKKKATFYTDEEAIVRRDIKEWVL